LEVEIDAALALIGHILLSNSARLLVEIVGNQSNLRF